MIVKKKRNRKKNAIEEKEKNLTKGVIKTKTERDGIHCFAAKLPTLFTKKGPILTKRHKKEKNNTVTVNK